MYLRLRQLFHFSLFFGQLLPFSIYFYLFIRRGLPKSCLVASLCRMKFTFIIISCEILLLFIIDSNKFIEFIKATIKDAKRGVFAQQHLVEEETFFNLSSDEDSDDASAGPSGQLSSRFENDDEDFVKKPPFRPLRKATDQVPVPQAHVESRVTVTRPGGGNMISPDKDLSHSSVQRARYGSPTARSADESIPEPAPLMTEKSGSGRGGRAASLAPSESQRASKAKRLTEVPADSTPLFTQLLKDFCGPNSAPEEQSVYSRKTTQIYQSEMFLGTLSIHDVPRRRVMK